VSIPTTGPKGVRFRSRLETRWACFFTLLGWSWVYEPDLGLEKWIPDFAIVGPNGPMLVEVKPALSLSQMHEEYTPRTEGSGASLSVLIVGAAFAYPAETGNTYVGLMGRCRRGDAWSWWPATLADAGKIIGVETPSFEKAQRLWVHASNALQWRKR